MAKKVEIDFHEPSINQLVFTDSADEAYSLVDRGYTIYFPSNVTRELRNPGGVYVLGIGKRATVNARLLVDGEEIERYVRVNFFGKTL